MSQVRAQTAAMQVHDRLRQEIVTAALPPRMPLSEQELTARFGVSRTPIREALVRLESEGLVRKEANRPYRVRQVSSREYFQSMRLREILEGEAIANAIDKLDPKRLQAIKTEMLRLREEPKIRVEDHWAADEELHTMIADGSGNAVMAEIIRELRVTTRMFELSGLPSRIRPDCEEHLTIIAALESGDPAKARAAIEQHIRSLATDVLSDIAKV